MGLTRWERQYKLLNVIYEMNEKDLPTTVREIVNYLQQSDFEINNNIVNSSIRHYLKNGLVRCRHDPYKRPFKYKVSNKGIEQLEWLETVLD